MGNSRSFTRKQLAEKASLTDEDFAQINQCRRPHNKLGFGYQVGFLRLHNRFPAQDPLEILDELVVFTGVQLRIDAEMIAQYATRQQTISEHQERIRNYLKVKRFGDEGSGLLASYLLDECFRHEQTSVLLAKARDYLKDNAILCPAESTLLRIVGEQRANARDQICSRIAKMLPADVTQIFDDLLSVDSKARISTLQEIKANPKSASPDAIVALTEKMKAIEGSGVLGIDLEWLNSNYQRSLYHYVRNSSADRLREVTDHRRNAALACFLWQSYRDAVDQVIDMFDKLMTRVQSQSKFELDERIKRQRKSVREHLVALHALGEVILDDSIDLVGTDLRDKLFEAVGKDQLKEHLHDIAEWVDGKSSHVFHGVTRRFSTLRKFAPVLLRAISFIQEAKGASESCLSNLEILRKMNDERKRKLPEEADCEFATGAIKKIIDDDGKPLDRRSWECALLMKVRDDIRSGNLAVTHSKRFGKFDDYFMPEEEWHSIRSDFYRRARMPENAKEVPNYLQHRLNDAFDGFLETAPDNAYAKADESGWQLKADTAETLDDETEAKLDKLRAWLGKRMRRIRLPDLLIEVENTIGFTKHFMTPTQRRDRNADDVCLILATIMAHGCNIGTYTMSQLIEGSSYKQLKRVSDWQMTQDAQRSALADMVSAISGLDASLHWGDGRTSASDGQRFLFPRKVIQRTYSTKFSDFALEFYSFVADNYAPYYSTPIECTDRDAPFVLDGVLYNESELLLEEHYTDTHGYTEINFAAFAILGRRFCPRIKGVKNQRIYKIDRDRHYGDLDSLVKRPNRTINTAVIASEWDRIGRFYASLERGYSTASLALRRLVGYSSTNRFHKANRDLGRVFKTEFILKYMSQPQLRRRIRRGTLKVEELHALARDVFYAKRGRINVREIQDQMNSCSCLTLILSCIIYWQANEISRVVSSGNAEADGIDLTLLKHISPIEWENVVLYGQYHLDRRLLRIRAAA